MPMKISNSIAEGERLCDADFSSLGAAIVSFCSELQNKHQSACGNTRRGRECVGLGVVCRYLKLNVNTFGRNLQLAALDDLDSLRGLVAGRSLEVLDLVNDVVALEDFAENDVAAVQPASMPCQYPIAYFPKAGGV